MKITFITLLIVFFVFRFCDLQAQLSGNYTINSTLPSTNRNYQTFNQAINDLILNGISNAVTFDVANGTYNEQITIPNITGSSATDTITFRSASGNAANVILQSNGNAQSAVVILNGAKCFRFNNLTITNYATNKINLVTIRFLSDCENIVLQNNNFIGRTLNYWSTDSITPVIWGENTITQIKNVSILNNVIKNGFHGISIKGKKIRISNNVISDFENSGINILEANCTISGNNINSSQPSSWVGELIGINLQPNYPQNSDSFLVYQNKITLTATGINQNATGISAGWFDNYTLIANNFISILCNDLAVGLNLSIAGKIHILFNTVKMEGTPMNPVNGSIDYTCIRFIEQPPVIFQNNIFINKRNAPILGEYSNSLNLSVSDYNVFYTTNPTFYQNNTSSYTLSQWRTATGNDIHSITNYVSFVSSTDLHLQPNQLYLRLNHPLAEVKDDIDSEIRSIINPYSGADEYSTGISFTFSGKCQSNPVNFQISNTTDIQSVFWNFGDSQTSTLLNPTHTYTNAGIYTVTLEVTYTNLILQTVTKQITINPKPSNINLIYR